MTRRSLSVVSLVALLSFGAAALPSAASAAPRASAWGRKGTVKKPAPAPKKEKDKGKGKSESTKKDPGFAM
jgi:ribosomal protein L12E/L44/L45/RPP1/RPP2